MSAATWFYILGSLLLSGVLYFEGYAWWQFIKSAYQQWKQRGR